MKEATRSGKKTAPSKHFMIEFSMSLHRAATGLLFGAARHALQHLFVNFLIAHAVPGRSRV